VNALRAIAALPFRLLMLAAGALAVAFVVIGLGFSLMADAFGGDRS